MIKETISAIRNKLRHSGRLDDDRRRKQALDDTGGEILDSTPMQPPIGYNPQPSMFDVMRDMMARHNADLARADLETMEEADDFDVDDDYDPTSPYEHSFDPPASTPEVQAIAPRIGVEPPADGHATPPATPAPAGSPAPAQGGPAGSPAGKP